jgi:hypothetical protein
MTLLWILVLAWFVFKLKRPKHIVPFRKEKTIRLPISSMPGDAGKGEGRRILSAILMLWNLFALKINLLDIYQLKKCDKLCISGLKNSLIEPKTLSENIWKILQFKPLYQSDKFVGIEKVKDYVDIAQARVDSVQDMFSTKEMEERHAKE